MAFRLKIKYKTLIIVLLLGLIFLFSINNQVLFAEESPTPTFTPTPTPNGSSQNQDKLSELRNKIRDLENKVSELQGQKKTLSSQIAVMDNQIKLTELRINSTKQEIEILGKDIGTATKKISNLEVAVDDITKTLLKRIVVTYEIGTIQPFHILLSSNNASDFFSRLNYLKIAQEHDKKLIYDTQQAKNDYQNQKEIFETEKQRVESLKKQLEIYTVQIDQEKKSKQQLLDLTNNSEKNYQDLLAKTRAEYEAIQGITAGKGAEKEVGNVNEGNEIASIISGSSACSTGTHLHFEVSNNGNNVNPTNYLSSKDVDWDLCGWYGCDGAFGFSGSWRWPIDGKPRVTQGYGMTAYARSGAYGGGPHTGIDMVSDNLSVKAVKDGILYQGSIACGGGFLRYVKVHNKDSNIDTYYLHVNYSF
ncbi:MAG: hypothetical protein M1268_00295 [Patescibacteria group bacterium]|nr:hypothetical protein [Patescibacteria group bacterium]